MFRKGLILGIIILFVGTSVTPSISIDVKSIVREDTGMDPIDGNNTWFNVTPNFVDGDPLYTEKHAMVFDTNSGCAVTFGGNPKHCPNAEARDTWAYNFVNNTWYNRTTSGNKPIGRSDLAMAYDSESDKTILFGGLGYHFKFNDTWAYDFSTNTWTEMSSLSSYNEVGGKIYGNTEHTMVYDSHADRIIMFGGSNGTVGYIKDTWTYDYNNNTWYNMSPTIVGGMQTGGIRRHAMAYDDVNQCTVLFGGETNYYPYNFVIRDTYVYYYDNNTWVNKTPTMNIVGGDLKPRYWHSMCYDYEAERCVMFGGKELQPPNDDWDNDTWMYSVSDNTWYNISYSTVGGDLLGREETALVYDSVHNHCIMFDGFYNGEWLNETWIFRYNTENEPPNTPTNPDPANGSINVEIDADISWYCWDIDLDDLTYDVYFEADDSTPDVKVSSNQTETTYNPGTMELDTTYYWQIVAWDTEDQSTKGPIWYFTTRGPNNPPNTPTNPNPEDGETDVDIEADLSWTGGDPDPWDTVTYDVYFEYNDSSPDVKVSSNQTSTSYDPGTMYGSSTYYWKIISWDEESESTEGPIWSFSTENLPPYQPVNPTPDDHATNVDINADLYWDGGDPDPEDTVTYDVYFGDSSDPPKIASNISEETYDPGTMEYNTQYYWRIVSWDNHGASKSGYEWDFKTGSEPNDPPEEPSNPSPADGATGVELAVVLSWNCSDPDGDNIFYDVYLEADDETPDILVANDITETTYDAGILEYGTTYYWQIIAIDEHSAATIGPIWHFTTEENMPPDMPSIDGPDRGKPETTYEYGFTSVDPEGHDIAEYIVKWGDGTGEVTIIGPFESGEEAFANHSWDEKGTYTIQAKAKDVYGAESNWSEFEVNIPRPRASFNSLFHWFLERFPLLEKLLNLLLL